MGFFGRSQAEPKSDDGFTAADWQSIASGEDSSRLFRSSVDTQDFVNPEGPINLGESSWIQERHSQQKELEDSYRSHNVGCCTKYMGCAIKMLHVIDICLGMTLIIYGLLLRYQFDQPAMAAVMFCLIFGSIIMCTSAAGVFSYIVSGCSRWGLLVSAFVAPYLSAVYFVMIIGMVMDPQGIFTYLDDHYEVMYIFSEDVDENLEKMMPLVYTVLGMMAALQFIRIFVVLEIREGLLVQFSTEPLDSSSDYFPVPTGDTLDVALLNGDNETFRLKESNMSYKTSSCNKYMGCVIKMLHVIDICLGMTLIIYGLLLRYQFDQPAMAAVMFCLIFGTVIFLTSAAGVFSFVVSGCSRRGLLVSAFVAPYLSAVYITMIIGLVMDAQGLLSYLDDHHEVMYIFSEAVDENLERMMPLVYTVLGMMAALQSIRIFVVLDVRKALLARDSSTGQILVPRSGYLPVPSASDTLNEALLDGEKESSDFGGGSIEKEIVEKPEWWVDKE